jgi:4-alpha-glucanotransferase
MKRRASGILLHVSSLPGEFGIGDLGPQAHRWIDFLCEARQSYWQVLPVNPTAPTGHNSPYQASSAFAGNPLLVSPALLLDEGLLLKGDISGLPTLPANKTDYPRASSAKRRLLDLAYERFHGGADFETFCHHNSFWLDDYAVFAALGGRFAGRPWPEWPDALRDRTRGSIEGVLHELEDTLKREKFFQYLFFKQWSDLKWYANQHGVQIVGDLPYYVGYDSADVWSHPGLFKLTKNKEREFLSGVPPDAFSDTGQLWGNPVYDWDEHKKTGYAWWVARLRRNLDLFDMVRIDHFRGFAAYWEVPGGRDTAVDGKWVDGPGGAVFRALLKYRPFPPFIAEDLGVITPDVRELMRECGFPGMKVLLFAFDGDTASNPYSLHNHVADSVLYTGTHDNNTVRGWFRKDAGRGQISRLADYLGIEPSESRIHWDMIRLAMMSVSDLVITPMQDVLGLDETARMNHPAVEKGNWEWRMTAEQATKEIATRLAHLAKVYGRA